jgi:O-antigen/teichoic acid export membrane protein
MGSMLVLSRLLVPADFGLVGMATVCTGFLELFRDAGLSMATIQRVTITRAQISTLFWINVAVGAALAALCAAMAPRLTTFYHEPGLLWVVFRMLAPAIFAFKLINPFGWFMQATGRATRSLYMGVLLAPIVILGYIAGLPYGAIGGYLSSLLVPELVGRGYEVMGLDNVFQYRTFTRLKQFIRA